MDIEIKDRFPIENPHSVSTRLFFAKESALACIWHLCDAALGKGMPDGKILFMALHGSFVYAEVRADTVLQAKLNLELHDVFCFRCIEEFEMAREIITERRLLKFR